MHGTTKRAQRGMLARTIPSSSSKTAVHNPGRTRVSGSWKWYRAANHIAVLLLYCKRHRSPSCHHKAPHVHCVISHEMCPPSIARFRILSRLLMPSRTFLLPQKLRMPHAGRAPGTRARAQPRHPAQPARPGAGPPTGRPAAAAAAGGGHEPVPVHLALPAVQRNHQVRGKGEACL